MARGKHVVVAVIGDCLRVVLAFLDCDEVVELVVLVEETAFLVLTHEREHRGGKLLNRGHLVLLGLYSFVGSRLVLALLKERRVGYP